MDKNYLDMLYLFSCAVRDIMPDFSIIENVPMVRIYAAHHGTWHIIYSALKKWRFEGLEMEDAVEQAIGKNLLKNVKISQVVKKAEEKGIKCSILKGATLSQLYAEPYARITTDVDIFVEDADTEEVCRIFEACGFLVKERENGSHHIKCVNTDCGMVEIHTEYFDKEVEKIWFQSGKYFVEDRIPFLYEGVDCHTLSITEGAIFNFLHFVKHFISGFVTVRQLMDNLLYLSNYKSELNVEKFFYIVDKLGYRDFLANCIGFGIKYLGFKEKDFDNLGLMAEENLVELLAYDLQVSSIKEDSGLFKEYSESKFTEQGKKFYRVQRVKINNGGFIGTLFLKKEYMKEKYPFLQRFPVLLPIMYVVRIVNGIYKTLFQKNENSAEDVTRMDVIKKLGL